MSLGGAKVFSSAKGLFGKLLFVFEAARRNEMVDRMRRRNLDDLRKVRRLRARRVSSLFHARLKRLISNHNLKA